MTWISTTQEKPWTEKGTISPHPSTETKETVIHIHKDKEEQTIDGFGTCFNELGWTSLSLLSESDRNGIIEELFKPGKGANFTICRMPAGANDFSLNWYSYDEHDDDYELKHFSIENDTKTLIPFIKSALKQNKYSHLGIAMVSTDMVQEKPSLCMPHFWTRISRTIPK